MQVWCAEHTVPGSGMDADQLPLITYVFFEDDGDDGCGNGTMRLYQMRFPSLRDAVRRKLAISYFGMWYYDGIIHEEDGIPDLNPVSDAEIEAMAASITEAEVDEERAKLTRKMA